MINLDHVHFQHKTVIYFVIFTQLRLNCKHALRVFHGIARLILLAQCSDKFPTCSERHNIEDKIHCTASKLDKTWLKSSLAIYHYVKVGQQQLDDICETRR